MKKVQSQKKQYNMCSFESIKSFIRCPRCFSSELTMDKGDDLICESCGTHYPISFHRPVLLRPDNELFSQNDYRNAKPSVTNSASNFWRRFIPSPSVNIASERVLAVLRNQLKKMPSANVLVVGGGRQRKWLDERLGATDAVRIVYTDVDIGADIDLFCDGHDLPFVDSIFDSVVTTAVLEHVLYPEKVAAEIIRVLKVNGFLYSELPFMQQVHEGAYDFTRYTMSGHRRLFNSISEITSGMVAGPGTALVWAIENFFLAFFTHPLFRKLTKTIVRLLFAWIKYSDYFLKHNPAAMDGASCTYLFGRKIEGRLADSEIIDSYIGAKHLRHT